MDVLASFVAFFKQMESFIKINAYIIICKTALSLYICTQKESK